MYAMKDNYTHICIVLDASGSMEIVESDTKGSFNTFIKEQQNVPGEATLDIYQFADTSKKIVDFVNLSQLQKNLMDYYRCDGRTALNDAVCQAIDETGKKLASMREEERPSKVLFVILTDGEENASRSFTNRDVKKRIQHQTDVYKWGFVFLGANQDAFATGQEMGIASSMCLNINTDSAAEVQRTGRILGRAATNYRAAAPSVMESAINLSAIADEVDAEENKSNSTTKKKTRKGK